MKAILINKDILEKKEITYEEIVALIALQESYDFTFKDEIIENLENKKYLKLNNNSIVVRQKGINFVNSLKKEIDYIGNKVQLVSKKTDREVNQEIEDRVEEYRNVFKGLKKGAMGSLTNCKQNLSIFLKNNPNNTFDQILNAAKVYVNSVNDFTYLQRADYFIYKENSNKIKVSSLEAYIDESIDETNNNWTSNLK
jgi:putative ubiquitin-RnfH superfamily antitoxin RatB of RatAB toxin-antitoxin module